MKTDKEQERSLPVRSSLIFLLTEKEPANWMKRWMLFQAIIIFKKYCGVIREDGVFEK